VTANWTDRKNAACPRGVGLVTEIYATQAAGSELTDEAGRATSISPAA